MLALHLHVGLYECCSFKHPGVSVLQMSASCLAISRMSFAVLLLRGTTMQQFIMWQPALMQVAQFLEAGVKRVREGHPGDESDI